MLSFLKFVGSLFKIAFGFLLGIFLLVFLGIIIGFLVTPADKESIEAKSVLRLAFNEPLREQTIDNPLANSPIPLPMGDGAGIGVYDMKENIAKAKNDKKIEGIYLPLSTIRGGFASIEEIRNALIDFKKSGKFVYAYGELYSEGAYYLASVADKIYLNPRGMMELNGLTAEYTFYKGTLDKLEMKAEIFRVGTYKSAVEPFMLDKMSDANKEQTRSFLNSIYDFMLANIAKSRGISVSEVTRISNDFLVRTPKDAKDLKIVTDLAYYDEVEKAIKKKIGIKDSEKINFVNYSKYEKTANPKIEKYSENKIAVIVGEGAINSGKSTDESIGSETIAEEIRKARKDKNVKAIVLRINSPGGSALASDVMWREVLEAKKEKPVIASMGDVAASGGYYMAMACNKIVAQPTTITGSIGIFGVLFNATNFYKNKLGMTSDHVSTGKMADIRSALLMRDLTTEEKEMIQGFINEGYEDFTAKAAQGRKMTHDNLKKIASGRVWSGKEAKENGLVDELGSFDDAIRIAAKEAKLKEGDYRIRFYPVQKTFYEKIAETFNVKADIKTELKKEVGELYPALKWIEWAKSQEIIQARLPYGVKYW